MNRDELIALVTHTLAIAQQRGDVPIIEICAELGSRLLIEEVPPATEPEYSLIAEVAPTEPEAPSPEPTECPVCAERRARRNAAQQRHRSKKRKAAHADG